MPSRNFQILFLIAILSLACHLRANRASQLLAYALGEIEQRYVSDVDPSLLFEGAMEGMVQRLDREFNDPNSTYIPPEEMEPFDEELTKEYVGIGIEVSMPEETKQLTVISPLYGSPAHEAGVRSGDRIVKVDGRSTQGLSLEDAVARMRGPRGTAVVLTVLHAGEKKPVELSIVRKELHSDTVRGDTRNADGSWNFLLEDRDRIGYVRIVAFTQNTPDELRRALEGLCKQEMRAMILDVRDNPGGLLQEAIDICDLFVSSGVIVSTRRRGKEICSVFEAHAPGTLPDFPMAVLVNQNSASASEILAACLQDHHRAVVVGQQSYGKGTVQDLVQLPAGRGMLKLTTATFWRPSGRDINRNWRDKTATEWGVRPDSGCEVLVEGDALRDLTLARLRRDGHQPKPDAPSPDAASPGKTPPPFVDPQRDKALQVVEERLADAPDAENPSGSP